MENNSILGKLLSKKERIKYDRIMENLLILIIGVFYGALAFGFVLMNEELNIKRNLMIVCILTIMGIIVTIYRLFSQKKGLLIISSISFSTLVILFNEILNKSFFGLEQMRLFQILFVFMILMILLDVVIAICNPLKLSIQMFTLKEITMILLAASMNFATLKSISHMENGDLAMIMIVFFISMTTMFAYFLVDKFGTIAITLAVFSALSAGLAKDTYLNKLFPKEDVLEVVIICLLIGLIVECVIATLSMKNTRNIFHPVRHGQVNNSYIQMLGSIPTVLIFALVVPFTTQLFAANAIYGKSEIEFVALGFVIVLFGGISATFLSRGIKESGLYNIIHDSYTQQWFREFNKWVTCCAIYDIDGDGKNEVIVGCADKYIYCFRDGVELWKADVRNTPAATCGVDRIGKEDDIKIAVGSYDGGLRCLSNKGEELWKVQTDSWVWSVAIGDADNDGENEVAFGGMDDMIHVCKDGGIELWSTYFDSWVGCVAIGDVDNDGINEVVAGSSDQTLRCYKNGPNEVWRAYFGEWVNGCAIGDVDGDGLNEVVAGGFDGTLRCYRNGQELWRVSIYGTIGAIAIGDVDNDGKNEIVVGCGDHTIRVYKNGKETWVGRVDRYPDGVAIGDADNDGINEFIAGDWYCYLRCFKHSKLTKKRQK